MNMRRLFKKLVFVCLLVVFGEKTVCHAHLPEYVSSDRPWWVFNTFEKWEVVNDTICGEGVQWNFFFLNGNTVTLNGKEYKPFVSEAPLYSTAKGFKAVSATPKATPFTLKQGENYTIGLRNEDGKVYANYDEYIHYLNYTSTHQPPYNYLYSFGNPDCFPYRVTDDGEVILYDYTMQEGDVYAHVDGCADILVSVVSEVTLADGKPRRRLDLSNGLVIIEGLGCVNSTGMLLDYLNPANSREGFFSYLEWYGEENGDFINDFATEIKIKDTGTSSISAPETSFDRQNSIVYDLQGRRLKTVPEKGVYFRGGKKIVSK